MTTATRDSTGDETRIKRVGVVGLGHMGHAFMNLIDDGYEVTVNGRDPKRAATMTNARAAVQLDGLAGCEVVLTSLPTTTRPPWDWGQGV